jgi:hypothetical protein
MLLVSLKRIAIVLAAFFCSPGICGPGGGSSKVDPYILRPPVISGTLNPINQKTSAVSLRASQTLNTAVRNLVLIGAGQSNMTNSPQASVYSPANAASIDQFSVIDSGIYNAADPLLGTSINNYPALGGGNPLLRIADAEITAGNFDHVLVASIAVDGTSVADWDPTVNGIVSDRFSVLFARLASKGIVAGTNVTIVVLWGQGETDTTNGTLQAAYTTGLNNVIAGTRASGFNGTWFVASQSYNIGSTSSNVTNAQAAVVNHGAGVWAGPNADAIIGTTCGGLACRPDNLHFGDNGMPVYTSGWQTALHAFGAPF